MCSSPAGVIIVSAVMIDEKKDASHSTPAAVKKKPCKCAASKPATLVGEGAGGGGGAGRDEVGMQCSVLTSADDVLLPPLLGRDVEGVFLRPQHLFLLMPVPKKDGRRCALLRCWHVAAPLSPSLLALLLAFIADDMMMISI